MECWRPEKRGTVRNFKWLRFPWMSAANDDDRIDQIEDTSRNPSSWGTADMGWSCHANPTENE